MAFRITTTGAPDPVVFDDLGARSFSHPTTGYDLLLEFSQDEINNSVDIQDAIDISGITVVDEFGNSITSVSNENIMSRTTYDMNQNGVVDDVDSIGGLASGDLALAGHTHNDLYEVSGAVDTHEVAWNHDSFALSSHDHDADYEVSGAVASHEITHDHDSYDTHLASGELHREINDSGYDATDLWSAQKISGELVNSDQLSELNDVTISAPVSGELLTYNGTEWIDGGNAFIDGNLDVSGDLTGITLYGDGSNITNIGTSVSNAVTIDARVNEAGGITKGQAVYINGSTGMTPQVGLCDNTDPAKTGIYALAAETRTHGQSILIRREGILNGVNTNSWNTGDKLYPSTAGALTNVIPTGAVKSAGVVVTKHISLGVILVSTGIKDWYVSAASGQDIDLRMGDNAGATHIAFENYNDDEVAHIDSLGNGYLSGDLTISGSLTDGTNATTPAQIRSHIDDTDKHREINDSGYGSTDLWSADQISGELAGKSDTSHTHDDLYETSGAVDSHESTWDHDNFSIVSHDHDADYEVSGAVNTHESAYDHDGYDTHLADADKHREINDTGYGVTDLWSADKISGELASVEGDLDEKVKISSNDTTSDYLSNKISGDAGDIVVSEENDGGNEYIKIDIGNNVSGAITHANVTTGNPHSLDASDVGADPAGTAASAVSTHESTWDHDSFSISGHDHDADYEVSGAVTTHESAYDHDGYDTHIADDTKHRTINDSGYSVTDLWSADQISGELAGKSDTSHNHDERYYTEDESDSLFEASGAAVTVVSAHESAWDHDNFSVVSHDHDADYETSGAVTAHEGTYAHGDIATNSAHRTTTTGNPHNLDHNDVGAEVSGAVDTHESSYDHDGYDTHVADADKHREINDSGYGPTDLWSAEKISGELENVSGGTGATELDELTDVTLSGPASGEVLLYNGAEWVNDTVSGAGGTDPNAIHDNVPSEIQAITQKVSPIGTDIVLIEDSEATWAKKRAQLSDFPAAAHTHTYLDNDLTISGDFVASGDITAIGYNIPNRFAMPVTYDSAGINAAIDTLGSMGGEIYLPAGDYDITAEITIDYSKTKIIGAGRATQLWASNRAAFDDATSTLSVDDTITGSVNSYTAIVRRIVYDTATTGTVWFTDLSNSAGFNDDEVLASGGNDITLNGASVQPNFDVFLAAGGKNELTFANFVIWGASGSGNTKHGITLAISDDTIVDNVTINRTGGNGIVALATSSLRVMNCYINYVGLVGISFGSGDNMFIRGNTIIGSGTNDITCTGADRLRIMGNFINGDSIAGKGIVMTGSNNCIVAGNHLLNHTTVGIEELANCDNNIIYDNDTEGESTPYDLKGINSTYQLMEGGVNDFVGGILRDIADPMQDQDAATKAYVDSNTEVSGAVATHESAWDHDNFAISGHDHDADYEVSGAVASHESTYDHDGYDTHLADDTKHRTINDSGYGDTDLWSANQISGELAGKADTGHGHTLDDLSDVVISAPTSGAALIYNGSDWIDDTLSAADADAIHDNEAFEISGITEKTTPASTDLLVIEDSAAGYVKKRVQVSKLIFPTFHFFADQFDSPNTADWAVNNSTRAFADSNNSALTVREFDDTSEEGVGMIIEIPTGATNIVISLRSRPETGAASNLGVVPKLYVREMPDNGVVESWSAGTDMTAITMGTSNEYFQYDTQTIALTTLSLVAGRIAQIELTRNTGSGSDTLVDDWNLLELKVSFT